MVLNKVEIKNRGRSSLRELRNSLKSSISSIFSKNTSKIQPGPSSNKVTNLLESKATYGFESCIDLPQNNSEIINNSMLYEETIHKMPVPSYDVESKDIIVPAYNTQPSERKEKGSITSKLISPLKDTSPSKFSEQKAQQNKLELLKKFDSRGLKDGEPRKVKIKIIKCNSTQKNQEEKADEKSQKNPIVLKKVKKQLDKSMPRIVGIPSLNDHRCSNHASYSA